MGKEIKLEQKFARKLGMRTTAIKLFNDLKDETEVKLDFKDIEFMSRSFAQEYVYQKDHSNIKIIQLNMSKFLKELLNVVHEDYMESCFWFIKKSFVNSIVLGI